MRGRQHRRGLVRVIGEPDRFLAVRLSSREAQQLRTTVPIYFRLAADQGYKSKFGHKPIWHEQRWCFPNASRYVRMFQSRRSLLVWKVLGERTDGFSNDDFPTETTPGDAQTLAWKGKPLEPKEPWSSMPNTGHW